MTQRKMKDSGVVWIGQVPEGWNSSRIKYVIKERVGGAWGNDPSEETGENVICLRIADFDFERGVFKNTDEGSLTVRNYTKRQASLLGLKLGDILVEKSGGGDTCPVGRCVLFDKSYKALFANFMDRLRADDALCVARFLQYWWKMMYLQKVTWLYVKQTIGIQNLSLTNLLNTELVALPSLPEQRKIAAFLDGECGKIDVLRGKVEKQIAALEEYRKSVITEAVTKGIKRGRKMKPSGVEWIGEVPDGWTVTRAKYHIFVKSNLVPPDEYLDFPQISPESIEKGNGHLGKWCTVEEACVESGNHLFRKGQILYSKIRPVLNKVVIAPFDGLCSADMYPIETSEDVKFVLYLMLSDYFVSQVELVTRDRIKMPKINQSELGNVKVVFPSISEQREIAAYLDKKCAAIDSMVAKCREELDRLAEYKKSLIYEYVTGKKEVA